MCVCVCVCCLLHVSAHLKLASPHVAGVPYLAWVRGELYMIVCVCVCVRVRVCVCVLSEVRLLLMFAGE